MAKRERRRAADTGPAAAPSAEPERALARSGAPAEDEASHIEKLARDPNINVEKLERLIAMRREELERLAKLEYQQAFVRMQAELPATPRRGNIHIPADKGKGREERNTPFAKLEHSVAPLRSIMAKHGFAFWHTEQFLEGGLIEVTCTVAHAAGHRETTTLKAPSDDTGSKNALQARGSTLSYLRRYTLKSLLGMVDKDEDDDGTAGGAAPEARAAAARPDDPKPAQRKSEQAAPAMDAEVMPADPNTGRVVDVTPVPGGGVLAKLETGKVMCTRNLELEAALRQAQATKRIVRVVVRASKDPAKFAPVLEELETVETKEARSA